MEVPTIHFEIISRSNGRSAIQMAAYCSRSRLRDVDGKIYDYTDRNDLVYHEVLLPGNAPEIYRDSQVLWESVEHVEKSRDAQLARAVILALPRELSHEECIEMSRQYIRSCFVERGMCADVSIHDKHDGNPHVHILLTTRSLDHEGNWMWKQKRSYLLNEHGERIRDPDSGRYKLGRSRKANDWDEPERMEEWRKGWADIWNSHLSAAGVQRRVTHLGYGRQGLNREPTKHLGARVTALERRGVKTSRGSLNREIQEQNRKKDRQKLRERLAYDRSYSRDYDIDRS